MANEVACFWCTDTGRVRLSLRRFVMHGKATTPCSGPYGYHNADVEVGDVPARRDSEGYLECIDPVLWAGDPRWPARCTCGYEFQPEDRWQVNQDTIMSSVRGEWPQRQLPPGAMFDAWWMRGHGKQSPGGDGIWLAVVMPPKGGDDVWIVDGPANNNPAPNGWTRSGTVPNVTARPSIQTRNYHGFLTNGVLVEC